MKQIGGSAALEGVMMKAPDAWALAVRLPSGEIHVERHEEPSLASRYAWARWPLVRGVIALFDALSVSYTALAKSAQLAEGDDGPALSKGSLYATMALSTAVGILLFIVLPAFVAGLFTDAKNAPWLYNGVAGLIKTGLLVGYLLFLRRFEDTRRFLMYHGAEHKAIHAYSLGLPLTVENVRAQPRFHPRCGTTFIAFVIVASIFVYSFLPHAEILWWRLAGRVVLLPLVAAVAFEMLRYSSSHDDPFSRALRWLGFQFQALTVDEPTDDMIEVAIESTKAALGTSDRERLVA